MNIEWFARQAVAAGKPARKGEIDALNASRRRSRPPRTIRCSSRTWEASDAQPTLSAGMLGRPDVVHSTAICIGPSWRAWPWNTASIATA